MDAVLQTPVRKAPRRIPRPITSRDAAVPRTYAAAARIAGRPERSPDTIATRVAEPTLDDDWVGRTPPAALILPPPPQFADTPTEQNTPTRPTPNRHTDPDSPPPSRNAIPHLVVDCLPNWTRHFRTIAAALGHAPNARAYGRGVIFSPKSSLEFETVQRCLIEAAAIDSAISWHRSSQGIQAILRRQPKTPAQINGGRRDTARPPAEAAPREAVPPPAAPPTDTPPTPTPAPRRKQRKTPDHTNGGREDAVRPPAEAAPREVVPPPAATPTESSAPAATPTPTDTEPPEAHTPTPTSTEEEGPLRERRRRHRRRRRAPRPQTKEAPYPPNCLDRMVQAIIAAITTGMAAYLHEKEAMPVRKTTHWAQSRVWRARAGGRAGSNTITGEAMLPRAQPG